jgi:hypothetical protein
MEAMKKNTRTEFSEDQHSLISTDHENGLRDVSKYSLDYDNLI